MMNEQTLREALQSVIDFVEGKPDAPEPFETARAALALPITAPGAEVPSDAEIFKVAETLGAEFPGSSNYDSWGQGYRKDASGQSTIPCLPRNVLPFARAILARFGAQPAAATHQQGLQVAEGVAEPVDMVLHCPACGLQHIDAPDERTADWKNEPHRSHLCHGCGHIWRPADVPTNGVQAVKTPGKADSPIATALPDAADAARWRMLPAIAEDHQLNLMGIYRDVDAALSASQAHGKSGAVASFFRNGFVSARSGEHSLISANADGSVTIAAEGYALVPIEHYEKLPGSYLALAAAPVSQAGAQESQPVAFELWNRDDPQGFANRISIQGAEDPAHKPGESDHQGHVWVRRPLFAAPVPKAQDAEKDAVSGPMTEAPEVGTPYWTAPGNEVIGYRWEGCGFDLLWLSEGRCFRTEADALAAMQAEAQKTGGAA